MNRNSYVTAALFVVFALLTVFYLTMDDTQQQSAVSQQTAPEGIKLEVNDVTLDNLEGTDTSPLQQLRLDLEAQRSKKVSELKEVVGSPDYDAVAKSEAKDNITKISKEYEHAQVLESMIKSKGYDDVLVRVNESDVQVIVQVQDQATVDNISVDAINELYMMTKTEFGNDPFVRIEFSPLNTPSN